MIKKIFIYGSSGHFREQLDWLKESVKIQKNFEIEGIIDDLRKDEDYDSYSKLKIYSSKSILLSKNIFIFIAVGDIKIRKKCTNEFKHFNFYNLIHPSSIISENSVLGKGVCIAPYTLINGNVRIGDFNNFNSMNDYIAKHLFERNHYYNQASNVIQCDLKNKEEIANEILNLSS